MKVLLATRNAGKLREFAGLLPGVELVPWPAEAPELPETGAFFADNALQKAEGALRWWKANRSEILDGVLSDDSGLCVDALWGGPGVLSARFASELDPAAKNLKLLALIPDGVSRKARFVCVLAFASLRGDAFTVSGAVEGTLSESPKGGGGFGYDPIFIPEGFDRTFGDLPTEVKQRLSHRARACEALRRKLGI
ncbi:MAG: non-canonical purine NTP pyrophosphatase [Acidobacteria bacterium]|nr:non-canonical purine NTP pyrophosphatase [Acidobacteriota bacterium]